MESLGHFITEVGWIPAILFILFMWITLAASVFLVFWAIQKFKLRLELKKGNNELSLIRDGEGNTSVTPVKPKKNEVEEIQIVKTKKVHRDCPLVGDVLRIIELSRDHTQKIFKLLYVDLLKEQMKFAEQHLSILMDKGREDLLRIIEVDGADDHNDMRMLMYFLYSQVLMNRMTDYLRVCFIDNGLEDMEEREWENYKKEQIRLFNVRCKSLLDSYNVTCKKVFSKDLNDSFYLMMLRSLDRELMVIFDNARSLAIEYKKITNISIKEFKGRLNSILSCDGNDLMGTVGDMGDL